MVQKKCGRPVAGQPVHLRSEQVLAGFLHRGAPDAPHAPQAAPPPVGQALVQAARLGLAQPQTHLPCLQGAKKFTLPLGLNNSVRIIACRPTSNFTATQCQFCFVLPPRCVVLSSCCACAEQMLCLCCACAVQLLCIYVQDWHATALGFLMLLCNSCVSKLKTGMQVHKAF